jgi:hypothetical protein
MLFLPRLDLRQVSRSTLVGFIGQAETEPATLDEIARIYYQDAVLMRGLMRHPRVHHDTLLFLSGTVSSEIREELQSRLQQINGAGAKRAVGPEQAANKTDEETTYQLISRMTVAEKVKFATRADKTARALLIRDPNKLVAMSVLESPKMTEKEVEAIAQSRNVSEDVLRAISKKREWMKNYIILHGLVCNPKTPVGISITLLPSLKTKDMGLLLKSRSAPEAVRSLASKLLKARTQT